MNRDPWTAYCTFCDETKGLAIYNPLCAQHKPLLAAAPELLQALQNLLYVCEQEDWDNPDDDLNQARRAIAKAEGRTS